jgi:magnesium-transporting ATPase (P-type)
MGGTRLPGEAELLQAIPALNAIDPSEATKMPLEARMYGIFAGFLMCWLIALARQRGRAGLLPPNWMTFTFVSFIAIMGGDGANATLYDIHIMGVPVPYLYEPRLDLRLATGLLSGIGMAGILLPMVNYALWQGGRAQMVFANAREFALLLIANAVLFFAVWSQSGLFFYPASALGVLGVLALISALNVVLVTSFVRREHPRQWWELLNPFALAVLFTALELGALSALRYALFGTAVLP